MFKNLRLSIKIFTGYIVVLLFLVILCWQIVNTGRKLIDAFDWVEHTAEVIGEANLLVKLLVDMETGQRGFLITGKDEFLEPYNSGKELFTPLIKKLQETVDDNPEQVGRLRKVEQLQDEWQTKSVLPEIEERRRVTRGESSIERVISMSEAATGKTMMDGMRALLNEFVSIEQNLQSERQEKAKGLAGQLIIVTIIGTLVAIIVSIILAAFITIGIVKRLTKSSDNLKLYATQILNQSTSLATSSQQIAQGAAEQASQVEETTASVEELTSMVLNNVENAKEAASLSNQASTDTDQGFLEMENMYSSMKEISQSSEEIRKVIKVIDDIAFQTNILALNAAVEAARAGEAGMGFAVVAEEVKNLANKSSLAAKDTADMIETTINRSQKGLSIAEAVLENLKKVTAGSRKVRDMSKEVESASYEQQKGLEQVNKSIIEFDKVVQDNVSVSENTSKSSLALNSQASLINEELVELIKLVKGGSYKEERASSYTPPLTVRKKQSSKGYLTVNKSSPHRKAVKIEKPHPNLKPEELIPFENDEEF